MTIDSTAAILIAYGVGAFIAAAISDNLTDASGSTTVARAVLWPVALLLVIIRGARRM